MLFHKYMEAGRMLGVQLPMVGTQRYTGMQLCIVWNGLKVQEEMTESREGRQ